MSFFLRKADGTKILMEVKGGEMKVLPTPFNMILWPSPRLTTHRMVFGHYANGVNFTVRDTWVDSAVPLPGEPAHLRLPEMPDWWHCSVTFVRESATEGARVAAARKHARLHRRAMMGPGDYTSSGQGRSSGTGPGRSSSSSGPSSGSGLRRDGPTDSHARDAEHPGDYEGKGGKEECVAQSGQHGHDDGLEVTKNFVMTEPSNMSMAEIYDLDWNEISETTVGEVQTPPQGYQVVNLQQSRVPGVVNIVWLVVQEDCRMDATLSLCSRPPLTSRSNYFVTVLYAMAPKQVTIMKQITEMVKEEQRDSSPMPRRKMGNTKTVQAWKRLVSSLLTMMFTARSQMVVDHIQQRNVLEDEINEKNYPTTKTVKKKEKTEWINQGIGKSMPRSTTQKYWPCEPETCQHPAEHLAEPIVTGTWWTCLLCGSRWERTQGDKSASSSTTVIPEAPHAKRLDTANGAYPEVLPAPKSKPEQGAVQL